ncbi:hypothetical protein CEV08_00445 [Bartonella tribocorum]|uniref:Uncharacterized protein n=1 Tax=Bartonella tribocorum TaxID=85701 RepID=A0A2M6UXY8_9HYPH|nr:hypothetical protein CEV08_00445 [Bartonella tribocorum]
MDKRTFKKIKIPLIPPLNARVIVTLEQVKGMIISVFTFYFSKNEGTYEFYAFHGRNILFNRHYHEMNFGNM